MRFLFWVNGGTWKSSWIHLWFNLIIMNKQDYYILSEIDKEDQEIYTHNFEDKEIFENKCIEIIEKQTKLFEIILWHKL